MGDLLQAEVVQEVEPRLEEGCRRLGKRAGVGVLRLQDEITVPSEVGVEWSIDGSQFVELGLPKSSTGGIEINIENSKGVALGIRGRHQET